jgi:hypothetical protein
VENPWDQIIPKNPSIKSLISGDYRDPNLDLQAADIVRVFNISIDEKIDRTSLARLVKEKGYVFIGYSDWRFRGAPYEKFTIFQKIGGDLVPIQSIFSVDFEHYEEWIDKKPAREVQVSWILDFWQRGWRFSREINLLDQEKINEAMSEGFRRMREDKNIQNDIAQWLGEVRPNLPADIQQELDRRRFKQFKEMSSITLLKELNSILDSSDRTLSHHLRYARVDYYFSFLKWKITQPVVVKIVQFAQEFLNTILAFLHKSFPWKWLGKIHFHWLNSYDIGGDKVVLREQLAR